MLRMLARFIRVAAFLSAGTLSAQSIPPIHAEALAGNKVILPDDLHGRTAILVIGFSQGSQNEVAAWGKRLAASYNDSPKVQYYELAMLASVPRPIRGFVLRSIRRSIPERAQSRFLPLTTDEDAWRGLAHYKGGNAASVLVIDPTGTLRWQTQGPVTEAAMQELQRHLP